MNIEFKNVDFQYQQIDGSTTLVLKSFNLFVKSGSNIAIVGPSGSGKSSILRLIAGLLSPNNGQILIDGKSPIDCQRNGDFGLVFQSPELLPWRTISKNVSLPLEIKKLPIQSENINKILKDVGLLSWNKEYPHQLSGGMQQRASLARALIAKSNILLLDEPFSQLDELLRFELLYYVQQFTKSNGLTSVLVTHDVSEAVLASDVIFILTDRPVTGITKIEIPIPYPRFVETAELLIFQDLVSRIRYILRTQHKIINN